MAFIPTRFRDATLTDLQRDLIGYCNEGKPVLAYRSPSNHGYGCSFLADWLDIHKGWYLHLGRPCHLKAALTDPGVPAVVVDMACAMQFMTARRNSILRAIETSYNGRPTLVMCHGIPPAWLNVDKWRVVDITSCPKPY